jgi:hypothetical protein
VRPDRDELPLIRGCDWLILPTGQTKADEQELIPTAPSFPRIYYFQPAIGSAEWCFASAVFLIFMKASCLICLLLLGLLVPAPAVEILQVPSPDNSNSLMVDKSGRRDVLQLRTGVKVVRLFYDDIDALKPYLARSFAVPAAKLGKITLPTYKSAKWISNARLEIVCAGAVIVGDTDREFDFTAVVDSSGKLLDATIVKAPPPPKPTPKQKATPSKKGRGRND